MVSRQKVALNKSVGQLSSVPVRVFGHLSSPLATLHHHLCKGVGVMSENGSEQECRTLALVLFVFFRAVPGGPVLYEATLSPGVSLVVT